VAAKLGSNSPIKEASAATVGFTRLVTTEE